MHDHPSGPSKLGELCLVKRCRRKPVRVWTFCSDPLVLLPVLSLAARAFNDLSRKGNSSGLAAFYVGVGPSKRPPHRNALRNLVRSHTQGQMRILEAMLRTSLERMSLWEGGRARSVGVRLAVFLTLISCSGASAQDKTGAAKCHDGSHKARDSHGKGLSRLIRSSS
jgi:hypothetical protein